MPVPAVSSQGGARGPREPLPLLLCPLLQGATGLATFCPSVKKRGRGIRLGELRTVLTVLVGQVGAIKVRGTVFLVGKSP